MTQAKKKRTKNKTKKTTTTYQYKRNKHNLFTKECNTKHSSRKGKQLPTTLPKMQVYRIYPR